MWGFFRSKPVCPVDPERQQWVDARFLWLQDRFGHDAPRRAAVVLPAPEFFPDPFEGKSEDVQPMLARVAGYMNIDPSRIQLCLYSEEERGMLRGSGPWTVSGSAGCYARPADANSPEAGPALIGIEIRQLQNPMALVATLAHELAHDLLLGNRLIGDDEPDGEPLTDLLTVFLGMGIFTANATIFDRGWSSGLWAGWQTSRHGYLDQRMFGYALSRFAHARGETSPSWIRHVRPDIRAVMKQGLRYLQDAAS